MSRLSIYVYIHMCTCTKRRGVSGGDRTGVYLYTKRATLHGIYNEDVTYTRHLSKSIRRALERKDNRDKSSPRDPLDRLRGCRVRGPFGVSRRRGGARLSCCSRWQSVGRRRNKPIIATPWRHRREKPSDPVEPCLVSVDDIHPLFLFSSRLIRSNQSTKVPKLILNYFHLIFFPFICLSFKLLTALSLPVLDKDRSVNVNPEDDPDVEQI